MKALALGRARQRADKGERRNRAARRAIARESRRAARRRGKRPNLANGFTPDLLDGIWQTVVEAADRLQTAIINLTTGEALKKKPNKATHQAKLRKTVMAGVATIAQEADKVERDARHLGRATATHIIDQAPQMPTDAQLRDARHMPKMPRNAELGTTVRTPKSLRQSVQDMAPTLYGTGSHLFDDIVNRIAAAPPESDTARRRIAQQILNEYKQRGITGFVDKAGRRWNMVSYVEMATRTAASELAARAHLNELQRAGIDVVRYTVMPNCHPWCQPFQGRLLSITGMTRGTYYGEKIVCSVPEAIARGARHVNCRHSFRAHLPGMTAPDPDTIDPGDYKATQQLRALEREIRREKRARDTALTPEEEAAANRNIQALQKQVREHVARTGIPRNRWREQVAHAL